MLSASQEAHGEAAGPDRASRPVFLTCSAFRFPDTSMPRMTYVELEAHGVVSLEGTHF